MVSMAYTLLNFFVQFARLVELFPRLSLVIGVLS